MPDLLRSAFTLTAALVASALAACATLPGTTASPDAQPATAPGASSTGAGATGTVPVMRWPVRTASHMDLWLHSFALLTADTTAIPLFKRNYRDSITTVKKRGNVLTALDANRETLARRLISNPALVQAQFLALQFATFAQMRQATDAFLQFQGEAGRAPDRATSILVSQLAAVFPTAADREWLRLFMAGVVDEQARFYDAEYLRVQRARGGVISAVDSTWQRTYRPKFERFLNNTGQRQGELYLSLPLGGEGRTSAGATGQTVVAVPFPERPADALQPIFVLAHEVTGNLVSTVVADNITPAQQRDGSAAVFISFGQVHGGLLLLQKIAPELVEPYARYYLAQGGKPAPQANAAATLRSAFPVPQAISDALLRQIEIVLAGI